MANVRCSLMIDSFTSGGSSGTVHTVQLLRGVPRSRIEGEILQRQVTQVVVSLLNNGQNWPVLPYLVASRDTHAGS